MVICLRHVVKLVEILFDSGAYLVMLGQFHCSRQGDIRTPGMDFNIVADLRFVALSFLLVHRHVDRDKVKGSWIQKLVSWTQEAIRGVLERERKSEDSKKHLACDVIIPMLFAEASSYEKHVFSNNLYQTPNAINQRDENHRDTYTATSPTPVPVRTTTTSQAGRASDGHTLDSHPTYQTTVELEINGDLNKMAENWTQEEMLTDANQQGQIQENICLSALDFHTAELICHHKFVPILWRQLLKASTLTTFIVGLYVLFRLII
jgi:hypothetical protein